MLVGPRTGASEWNSLDSLRGCATGLCLVGMFGGGMFSLVCFEESGSWWFLPGFSDNVSHILVGAYHGCCSRTVTSGIDSRVLDGVNVWSLVGFGWVSFAWVRYTGFTDGGFPMGSIPGAAHW